MTKKLKISMIAAEVSPFSKTGGLAEITRSLPKAIKRLGHDVMIITPLYGQLISKESNGLKMIEENVEIYLNSVDSIKVNFWKGYLMKGLPVYFIENKKYFSQRKSIYGSEHENARFLVFNVAALKLLTILKYKADIIHCHDWHSGLIPFFLKNDFRYSKTLQKAKTVFTIHNLAFQLGHNWWGVPAKDKDFGRSRIPHIDNRKIEYVNFAKRAILSADIINTVSEQYREEIMTKHFGQDLHRILKNREDRLFGILNGIDYKAYNPAKDKSLFKNYDHSSLHRKRLNKEYLQKKIGLPIDPEIAMIGLTSRVTFQKGFELIIPILEQLLRQDVQMVILGDGDKKYINELKKIIKKFPKKIAWLPFKDNGKIETLIYAGSDIFLLPSHHEPCGINQLIAMRYGCIPVVRRVGGLYDTVTNYNPSTGKGTGFTFTQFNALALYGSLIRAVETYYYKDIWSSIVSRVMQESNSWEIPAKKYIALYKKALGIRSQRTKNN